MQNIILTGFMGTGKTTVGEILAARLHRSLVDIDREVEAMEGRDIPRIFQEEGEEYFRRRESMALARALKGGGKVIATGGGALILNRRLLEEGGVLICLTASPEEVIRRLESGKGRPLVEGDVEDRVRALLAEREGLYARVPRKIHTDGKTPHQVAGEILELLTREGVLKEEAL